MIDINPNIFCSFIGYGKSGHTIVSALIDAHKNATISNQQNIICNQNRHSIDKLYKIILGNSKKKANTLRGARTKYLIDNEWHGKFEDLKVIGDKRAEQTNCLYKKPELINDFGNRLNVKMKFIYVIRNPFDIVTRHFDKRKFGFKNFGQSINHIDNMTRKTLYLVSLGIDYYEIHLENLIYDTEKEVRKLLQFLELDPYKGFTKNCKKVLYSSPRKIRFTKNWSNKNIQKVYDQLINKYDQFNRYSFEG